MGIQDHGPREAWLALRASPRQSGRPLDEREHFFGQLSDSVEKYQRKGIVLLCGDCNARIGPSSAAEEPILGPHTFVGSGGS
eukprot:15124482-Alexandrium_andersonii.AAC.1